MTAREPIPPENSFEARSDLVRCSVKEAARVLGISENTVRKRIKAGRLLAERDGQRWNVFLSRDLLAQAENRTAGSTAPLNEPTTEHTTQIEPEPVVGQHPQTADVEQSPNQQPVEAAEWSADQSVVAAEAPARERAVDLNWQRFLLGTLIVGVMLNLLILPALYLLRRNELSSASANQSNAGSNTGSDANSVVEPTVTTQTPTPVSHRQNTPVVMPTSTQISGGRTRYQNLGATPSSSAATHTAESSQRSQAPIPTVAVKATVVVPAIEAIARAETQLHTGELEASIAYSGRLQSSTHIRFNFGDAQQSPRFHIVTTYQQTTNPHRIERLMIGSQSWQRQEDGTWMMIEDQEGAWGQVQTYLPRVGAITDPTMIRTPEDNVLQWYDQARDVDVILHFDPATGRPLKMRQSGRASDSTLTVTYNEWNTDVSITPPTEGS